MGDRTEHVLYGVYSLRDEHLPHAAVVRVLVGNLAALHALLVFLQKEHYSLFKIKYLYIE